MDETNKPKPNPKAVGQLQIQIDDDTSQGVYCNLVMINHTETEFTLDFMYVQPQQPKAKVRARIITSPKHTKRILNALTDNIQRYEARHGEIVVGPGTQNLH